RKEQGKAVPGLAAQGPETGAGLGKGFLNCVTKSETYFLFDESELAREGIGTSAEYLVFEMQHSRASSLPQEGVHLARL
ncbi:hypothetical protein BW687_026505, partial [Pseudomonas graminis]|uniref:hypothetical protein n=1 Tax=Pseudomonas graminis TaxID=158627 RepID=UPI00234B5084